MLINKQKILSISLISLGLSMSPLSAEASEIYQSEVFNTSADAILIDADDNALVSTFIQFGNLINKTLQWNIANSRFEFSDSLRINGNLGTAGQEYIAANHEAANSDGIINLGRLSNIWQSLKWDSAMSHFDLSNTLDVLGGLHLAGDLDLGLYQLQNTREENLSSAPVCNAGSKGRLYFNTTNNRSYVCDGSNFVNNSKKFYTGNAGSTPVLTTDTIVEVLNGTTAASNTMYLTDNGLVSGNKLFTTVYSVQAAASEINATSNSPFLAGYSYNSSTGLLTLEFLESAGILIGGQGLEQASAGTTYTVTIIGK